MAGPDPLGRNNSSQQKKASNFNVPEWLMKEAVNNANKYGYPQVMEQTRVPMTGGGTVAQSSKEGASGHHQRHVVEPLKSPSQPNTSPLIDNYPVPSQLPNWYMSLKDSHYMMKQLAKKKPQALSALDGLKDCISRCEKEKNKSSLAKLYNELRDHVHKAEITLQVNEYILRKARILHPESGLPAIFSNAAQAEFPWDLRADAYQLYRRWYAKNFDNNLLRGIKKSKDSERNADSIDPIYRRDHGATWRFYGEGKLVLGQWWPTQLCAVRDGAHGSSQGGISGEKGKGAYSIVLSSGSYDDEDQGDEIWYSGTDGKDYQPTEHTAQLIETCEKIKMPVRVLRSHQLKKSNPYRPVRGLRYDGLYKVLSYTIVDNEKAICKFHLKRCLGQHPIRYKDNATRRPTKYEELEDDKLRK